VRKLVTIAAAMGFIMVGDVAANSQALTFCAMANQVDQGLGLQRYSDDQIRNGLCMTSRELVKAMANNDTATEEACNVATVAMYREFVRRFPGRDPKSVIGRC
jgi:hypothetical protein